MPRSAGTELALLPFVIEKGAPTMKSIAIVLAIVFTCAASLLTAQNPNIIVDTAMTAKIRAEAMSGASQVSPVFDTLTIDIGPRLTNSPAYYRAVDFVADKLKLWGLDTHREPWKFGRGWTLDQLTLEIVEPRFMPLIGYAEGWSPSTAGELAGAPIYLGDKTPAQIDALKPALRGAIVMPLPPETFYVRQDRPQPTTPGIVAPFSLRINSHAPAFQASFVYRSISVSRISLS
jgi:hypothetical protein